MVAKVGPHASWTVTSRPHSSLRAWSNASPHTSSLFGLTTVGCALRFRQTTLATPVPRSCGRLHVPPVGSLSESPPTQSGRRGRPRTRRRYRTRRARFDRTSRETTRHAGAWRWRAFVQRGVRHDRASVANVVVGACCQTRQENDQGKSSNCGHLLNGGHKESCAGASLIGTPGDNHRSWATRVARELDSV